MSQSILLARLAGLPATSLESFSSPSGRQLLEERYHVLVELGAAQESLADAIGVHLTQFSKDVRRFLLKIRRNCFNHRSIEAHQSHDHWPHLLAISHLPRELLELEGKLNQIDRRLSSLYRDELERERDSLHELTEDRCLLRGMALSRKGLVEKIRLQRTRPKRKSNSSFALEKWELSALRFVTRAASKLSANSTLTTMAIGSASSGVEGVLQFYGGQMGHASQVRINRPQIEQFLSLLARLPIVRDHFLVAWNDSVKELEPRCYSFLKEAHWDLDSSGDFRYARANRLKIKLEYQVPEEFSRLLREGPMPYQEFIGHLKADPSTCRRINQLIDVGFLLCFPPWPTYVSKMEEHIQDFLSRLPSIDSLLPITAAGERLLRFEAEFAKFDRAELCVEQLHRAFEDMMEAARDAAGIETPISAQAEFFEEVLSKKLNKGVDEGGPVCMEALPREFGSGAEDRVLSRDLVTFEVSTATVEEILQTAGQVRRFAGVFNHRHDVIHTLAAWWRTEQPSRVEIPFLDLARAFGPIWKQFLQFYQTRNDHSLTTFNPLGSEAVRSLLGRRRALLEDANRLLDASVSKDCLSLDQLDSLLSSVPGRYRPMVGSCVFAQPVDSQQKTWVLNRVFEGTGRYLTRVIPVLDANQQAEFIDFFQGDSNLQVDGEDADFLEVMFPWGYLMNAHPPLTSKVLEIRGLHSNLSRERRVPLHDLRVRVDLMSESFRLVDGSGRRLIPVHLSSLTDAALSPLLRFLLVFGPGETRGVMPFASSSGDDNCRVFRRLSCGNVVVRRQRWEVDIRPLQKKLKGLSGSRMYAYVDEWRCRLGLPDEVFFLEHTFHGGYKPQFIRFSSPTLSMLFVSSIRRMEQGFLSLEEALPSPRCFPKTGKLDRRGFELLIDELAVRTSSSNRSVGVLHKQREDLYLSERL